MIEGATPFVPRGVPLAGFPQTRFRSRPAAGTYM
jgi:hypothetical protein